MNTGTKFSHIKIPHTKNSILITEKGHVFFGNAIGACKKIAGELCFNTASSGYQEILTDPSYTGQIITFTFPHIGNVGVNFEDIESENNLGASGLVIRENITRASNFRAKNDLEEYLIKRDISGICNVDTRAITKMLRDEGSMNCIITPYYNAANVNLDALYEEVQKVRKLSGLDLAREVCTKKEYQFQTKIGSGKYKIVAIDYGIKLNILRILEQQNMDITVLPANTSFEEIQKHDPDGIFLSNGPGDPEATYVYAAEYLDEIVKTNIPIFGICLGHQLLSLTAGAKTVKMHIGHRGANHPVKNLKTGNVEISSQNHGFMVDEYSLPDHVEVTHISLFDKSIEGIKFKDKNIFSVQYHPESSPGPHDSHYLFEKFKQAVEQYSEIKTHNIGLKQHA